MKACNSDIPLLFTHNNCVDGFGCYYELSKASDEPIEVVFLDYGPDTEANSETWVKKCCGRHVIVADFSFGPEVLSAMAHVSESFTMMDHHAGVLDTMRLSPLFDELQVGSLIRNTESPAPVHWCNDADVHFFTTKDVKGWVFIHERRCGARMVSEFVAGLRAPMAITTPPSALLEYIDANDRFDFPPHLIHPRAISYFLRSFAQDLGVWALLEEKLEQDFEDCLSQGLALERGRKQEVANMLDSANYTSIEWCGRTGFIINASQHLSTDYGNALAQIAPDGYAAVWTAVDEHLAKVSLRAQGDAICVDIAKHFGGNGHPRAAGFYIPLAKLIPMLSKVSNDK